MNEEPLYSPDAKLLANRIISRFLDEARLSRAYKLEAGFGGTHGIRSVIVPFGSSLGVKAVQFAFMPCKD